MYGTTSQLCKILVSSQAADVRIAQIRPRRCCWPEDKSNCFLLFLNITQLLCMISTGKNAMHLSESFCLPINKYRPAQIRHKFFVIINQGNGILFPCYTRHNVHSALYFAHLFEYKCPQLMYLRARILPPYLAISNFYVVLKLHFTRIIIYCVLTACPISTTLAKKRYQWAITQNKDIPNQFLISGISNWSLDHAADIR